MSQTGLLSEEELTNFINETFELKFDKDVLIKPTKSVITDIYCRFLDALSCKWRKPRWDPEERLIEPEIKALMVGNIRSLLSKYNTPYTFQITDLLLPTRKRTTTFLNVLVFIIAQLEDVGERWNMIKEERLAEIEESTKIDRELNQERLKLQELLIKNANSRPLEEIAEENRVKRSEFERLKRGCDEKAQKAQEIKNEIKRIDEENLSKQAELQTYLKEAEELKQTVKLLDGGRDIKRSSLDLQQDIKSSTIEFNALQEKEKEKLQEVKLLKTVVDQTKEQRSRLSQIVKRYREYQADFERKSKELDHEQERWNEQLTHVKLEKSKNQECIADGQTQLSKMKLQHKIELDQMESKLEANRTKNRNNMNEIAARRDQYLNDISNVKEEINRIREVDHLEQEKLDLYLQKAEEAVNSLKKTQSGERDIELIKKINHHRERIESVLTKKECKDQSTAADRTYIKSKDPLQ